MDAGRLDFDRDCNVPVSGRTSRARHASSTGAQAHRVIRSQRVSQVLAEVRTRGRLTLSEAAGCLGIETHRLCSTWDRLKRLGWIQETGAFKRYTTSYGKVVEQQYCALTARGREAAQ